MRYVEKQIVLQVLDSLWREHLVTLDHLRQVIGWRGLAQRDPLNEYKSEAFQLFNELITQLRETTTAQLARVEIAFEQPDAQMIPPLQASQFEPMTGGQDDLRDLMMRLGSSEGAGHNGTNVLDALGGGQMGGQAGDTATLTRKADDPSTWGRVARNAACPCGSGKKYKHCHGALGQHGTASEGTLNA